MLKPRRHLVDRGAAFRGTAATSPPLSLELRLHRNERVVPFPETVHAAMIESIRRDDIICYPENSQVIASVASDMGIDPECMTLFAGSESAVRAVFDVMIEPGELAVCLSLSYHGYVRAAFSHNAELRIVPYDAAMRVDSDAILTALGDRARVVFLGNPDGLGRAMPRRLVLAVLERLERTGGLLVIDEAYHHFGAPSLSDLVAECPQLAVLRTFSKAWGLAGVRCGYVIAHPATSQYFRRIQLRNEVSGPTLAIVRYALGHPELRDEYTRAVTHARGILTRELSEHGYGVIPSLANFLVIRPPAGDSVAFRDLALTAGIRTAALSQELVRMTLGPLEAMWPVVELVRSEMDAQFGQSRLSARENR